MNRRNLHFNALRAFEAAARHASVSGAARELSVTHSAVSHQIKLLETSLGVALFKRTNRGLKITREGETLLPTLVESFDRISASLDEIRLPDQDGAIQITTTPSFASKWLVPRLPDWYSKEGAARVHLHPSLDFLDIEYDNIDFAIRCGIPPWPGLEHELIMPIHLVPVCSPDYVEKNSLPISPVDSLSHNLIHADVGDHRLGEEWSDWFKGCGVEPPNKLRGLSFHDPALAMQAAADGLGLAIGYLELTERDLENGKLITAFEQTVKHRYSYYLVYKNSLKYNKPLWIFRDWLMDQF